ncbi:MAG: hypothetical protein WBV82_31435 [Myxococcaceae bacterium]
MSTNKQGTKILARTFFNQLRTSGYNSNQVIGIATELLDLVTSEIREADKVRLEATATDREPPRA